MSDPCARRARLQEEGSDTEEAGKAGARDGHGLAGTVGGDAAGGWDASWARGAASTNGVHGHSVGRVGGSSGAAGVSVDRGRGSGRAGEELVYVMHLAQVPRFDR